MVSIDHVEVKRMDRAFVLRAVEQTLNRNSIRMRVTLSDRHPENVLYLQSLLLNQMITMSKDDIERIIEVSTTGTFGEKGTQFVITMTQKFDVDLFARTAPTFLEKIEVGKK